MMADCADALERMELAAVEPGGLERLMAGDTPDAAVVAGHLAACPGCVAVLARLRRSSTILRDVLGTAPDDALRERTLSYVREIGRSRSPSGDAPSRGDAGPSRAIAQASTRRWGWVAGIAASAALAVGLTAAVVVPPRDAEIATQAEEIAVLSRVSSWTVRVEAQADATRIDLTGSGPGAGSLVYSPSSGELVVVATGLEEPDEGSQYGCWLESKGDRRWIGRMRIAGDLAAWAGEVDGLEGLDADAVFSVSLDPVGSDAPVRPVLSGEP
jgi:hypothetical protein